MPINSQPLVALGVRTDYPAPDLLGNQVRLSALRGQQQAQQIQAAQAPLVQQQLEQENQMRAEAIRQQQALNQAYHDALSVDPQGNPSVDYEKLSKSLAANNAGAKIPETMQAVTAYQESRAKLQQTQTALANETKDSLGLLGSAIQHSNYDPALADLLIEQHLKTPGIQPQEAQQLQQLRQQLTANPQMLKTIADNLVAQSPKQAEFAKDLKVADIRAAKQPNEATVALTAQGVQPGQQPTKEQAQAALAALKPTKETGADRDAQYQDLQAKIAKGETLNADERAFMKGYEKQKLLVPATTANIRLEGYAQSREYPVFDTKDKSTKYISADELNRAQKEEPGRYTVASFTPEAIVPKEMAQGTKQIIKPLTAFNTAIEHLGTLDRLANDLGNSDIRIFNRAKQEWAAQTGNPAPANFGAARNAMAGEVAQALKASGATDQEIKSVGDSFDRAQSPAQLKGAIGTYRELLKTKAEQLKRQYTQGLKGQPAFGESTETHQPGKKAGLPEGQTGTGSDGKKYVVKGGVWVAQ